MSSFDTARDLRMPGVVIERVYVDPKLLTTRMKNSIKAMLREGLLKGGWSSQSKRLAQKLTEGTDVMMIGANARGFYAPARHTYSDAVAEEVCALIDADEALELLSDDQSYNGQSHLEGIKDRTRERHTQSRLAVRTAVHYRWCWLYSDDLISEVAKVFASTRSAKQLEAAEKLCDLLDSNTPIPITLAL